MSSPVGPAPTSASRRVSSSSSQSSSVRWSLDRTASSRAPRGEPDFESRSRNRARSAGDRGGHLEAGGASASSGAPPPAAPPPVAVSASDAGARTGSSGGGGLVRVRAAAAADEQRRHRDDDGQRDAGRQEDLERLVGHRDSVAGGGLTTRTGASAWADGASRGGQRSRWPGRTPTAFSLARWRVAARSSTCRYASPRRPSPAGTGRARGRRARRPPRRRQPAGRRRGSCGRPEPLRNVVSGDSGWSLEAA